MKFSVVLTPQFDIFLITLLPSLLIFSVFVNYYFPHGLMFPNIVVEHEYPIPMSPNFGFAILDFGLTPPSSVELENFRLAILD